MGFFKENLFFVLLAAGVVLIGGVLLAVASSVGDDVDQRLKKRRDTAPRLVSERESTKVNPRIVRAEDVRVHTTRNDANDVQSRSIDWNRKKCKPLRLPLLDEKEEVVGHVDAFPIDPKTYLDYSLRYRFTHEYLQEMEALRRKLKPATLPEKEDLVAAEQKWQHHIKKQAELDAAKEEEAGPAERDRTQPGLIPGHVPSLGRVVGPGGGEKKASMFARRDLMTRQARKGWMYVEESAMEKAFPIAMTGASDKQIWGAQLNLWVTADIVEAIVATNKEAFAKLPENKWSVWTAAIKRLMHIRVDKDYFTGGVRPGYKATLGLYDPRSGLRSSDGFTTAVMSQTTGKGLTGRTISTDYDVVHYSFSVIMSEKYLPLLQRNLEKRNLHTILKVEEEAVAFNEKEMYYYGTEPVVQVTMEWELLLLTAWERGSEQAAPEPSGRARSTAAKRRPRDLEQSAEPVWKKEFPPLMPLEVLKWIEGQIPAALRDVDRRRLERSSRL